MKILAALLMLCSATFAADTRTVTTTCEKAIHKAMVLAAFRKWSPMRPSPDAMVLNIDTHANFSKNLVNLVLPPVGSAWSHQKSGELAFEEDGSTCTVTSNGHPADVVMEDLHHAFTYTEAQRVSSWWNATPTEASK